jgi:hypothetical protein
MLLRQLRSTPSGAQADRRLESARRLIRRVRRIAIRVNEAQQQRPHPRHLRPPAGSRPVTEGGDARRSIRVRQDPSAAMGRAPTGCEHIWSGPGRHRLQRRRKGPCAAPRQHTVLRAPRAAPRAASAGWLGCVVRAAGKRACPARPAVAIYDWPAHKNGWACVRVDGVGWGQRH